MIKSAEMPRANLLYKAKSDLYDAVCMRATGPKGKYGLYAVLNDGHRLDYRLISGYMSIRKAREELSELALLKMDISGNYHLIEI